MLASLLACAIVHMPQDPPKFELENYWFVYFVSGKNTKPLTESERAAAMEGHLGNLTRLAQEGKALAAGPFEGNQARRGIVLLKGDKYNAIADVAKEFANDPFVREDRLAAEIRPWATVKGAVHPWRKPEEMKSYVFVILERGENRTVLSEKEGDELQTAHLGHIVSMQQSGGLGIAGPFRDDGDMRGILIFKHKDTEKAKALVGEDPLIKAGRLKATYLTLWMAAGIVGD